MIVMKKLLAIFIACVLAATALPLSVSADGEIKLPFELIPPKTLSMSKVYDNDSTDINLSFSKEQDMVKFMQDLAEPDKRLDVLKNLGVDDIGISAQIDWALDDKTDWHHDTWWDDNEATHVYGIGYDKDGHARTNEWDIVDLWLYPQASEEVWITRYGGNPEDLNDTRWFGEDFEDGVHRKGMKDVLKEGQYIIKHNEDGEAYFTIDYTAHTLYTRMRYYVWFNKPDAEGDLKGYKLFSDWSEVSAFGKDGNQWKPYAESDIPAPAVSDGYVNGKEFNGYPEVSYKLTIPEDLSEKFTKIRGFGGYVSIGTEARIKGTDQWIERQGSFEPGTDMYFEVLELAGEKKPIYKGTEIEFRTRYFITQRMGYNTDVVSEFYSPYSEVQTVVVDRDYMVKEEPTVPPVTVPDETQPITPDVTQPATEPKISSLTGGATQNQVTTFVKSLKSDSDPKGSTFGILSARQKKVKNNSISISWNKVKGAKSYAVYANKCGKKYSYEYLATVKGTSFTQKNLQKGTYYKYLVTAFDGSTKLLATSKTLHIATKGGKNGNFKKVTTAAKKDKVTLKKKGKSFKLKAKAVPESKKLKVSVHRVMKYESSDPKVATVDSKGKITAKKKGSCFVYAYAQSGAYKKIKVTVKK